MKSGFCPNCKTVKNMGSSVYNREKVTQDGDIINIKTTSFHCETCNLFIDSEDVIIDGVRRAKSDRRKNPALVDENHSYTGTERRSGTERRIWVNRLSEIQSKL